MRRCRYRGQTKAHLQHVLTAIAVNIERLSGRSVTEETSSSRPPTAFQTFLDQQDIPRPKSWLPSAWLPKGRGPRARLLAGTC
ncbi:transposase [Streptomyces viridiviolaceus]